VRVKDVARIELGAQDYSLLSRLNGKPSAIIAVYQLPGSNAVDAASGINKLMAQMKQRFPTDMDSVVSLDQTRSVTEGIKEIIETLVIAIILVILVVYLFLQGWRATLIPLLAVPVSLVGDLSSFRYSDSRSTRSLCSVLCWPSGWWLTMQLLWSRL
jgi:Cation/multidrug efflux pump